jgi:hypothetical protein
MRDLGIEKEFASLLKNDEEILWSGRPKQGVIFRGNDILLIPMSLYAFGFTVFWVYTGLTIAFPFGIFGLPFLIIFTHLAFFRFFKDAKRRKNTVYCITNKRVLINPKSRFKPIIELNLSSIHKIKFNQNKNNVGTIIFGSQSLNARLMDGVEWPGVKQPPKFEFIESPKIVYDIIAKYQRRI